MTGDVKHLEDGEGGFSGGGDQRLGSLVRGEHWQERELLCMIRKLTSTQRSLSAAEVFFSRAHLTWHG